MINLAKAIGRVMMTAVSPSRPSPYKNLETYVQTEFSKSDQAYIMDCMRYGRPIDYRNIV